ncbi:MAG: hypothetical protein QM346_09790 [Chloroflexota bacterium]|nr:hypothetical protein [Chloroflexota bacterium]
MTREKQILKPKTPAVRKKPPGPPVPAINPLLRIAGRDPTADAVLAAALQERNGPDALPIQARDEPAPKEAGDPFQIDLSLALDASPPAELPNRGVSYAGLTPSQRMAFLQWAANPLKPASEAFQRLYVASLEVGLLDPATRPDGARSGDLEAIRRELVRCAIAPAWRESEWLARTMLLALWLTANGSGISEWLSTAAPAPAVLSLAIGLQALLGEPLRPEQLPHLVASWRLPNADLSPEVLALRLSSLTHAFGAPPLQVALQRAADGAAAPRPWRSAHPSLRFSLPQPDLRPTLEPLLVEMLAVNDADSAEGVDQDVAAEEPDIAQPSMADMGWRLILEFGQSRSEFYDHAVHICRRMPEYMQIMDEDRRLVHRVAFRKSDMRRFWRIWDYVQNWSATRVYLNGEEIDRWKIWPYSQYLR